MHTWKLYALIPLLLWLTMVMADAAPPAGPALRGAMPKALPTFKTAKGRIFKLGFKKTPRDQWSKVRKIKMSRRAKLPASVDLTSKMPPIGDQGAQGSCTAWASTYYLKSYEEGLERNWSLNTTDHQYSPAWTYNQTNYGWDGGAYVWQPLELLTQKGAVTLASMPYNQFNYTDWPTGNKYLEAMPLRSDEYGALFLGMGSGTTAVEQMKSALAAGYPVVLGFTVYDDFDPVAPYYIYDAPGHSAEQLGGHAVCVVGYDDSIAGIGGFKFLNSWGTSWGNQGAAYLSYNFIANYADEGWIMSDRQNYTPQAWVHLTVQHSYRGDLWLELGRGDHDAPTWNPIIHRYQGGSGDNLDYYIDVTDACPINGEWWLAAYDGLAQFAGSVQSFSLVNGSGGEVFCPQMPMAIPDDSTLVFATVVWRVEPVIFRARTAPGGEPLTETNYVTVQYTRGGQAQSGHLWDGHDLNAEADIYAPVTFSTSSAVSNAAERWVRAAVTGPARSKNDELVFEQTYYHQLSKLFTTSTSAAPMAGPGNYFSVTYQSAGAPATAQAYDGLTSAAAVWADRGSQYAYGTSSSASTSSDRWIMQQAATGTVEDNTPVSPPVWHQYKPTLTLTGTDETHTTALMKRKLFGADALARGLFGSWTGWCDAGSTLEVREYTNGEPRRLTLDDREWIVDEVLAEELHYAPYFAIQGYVRRADGQGVEGVRVQVGDQQTETDANGFYRVRDLPAGTYTVTPSGFGLWFIPHHRDVTVSESTGNAGGTSFKVSDTPEITDWLPRGRGQLPSTRVQIHFSQPMNRSSVAAGFRLLEMYGDSADSEYRVSGRYEWNAELTHLTFIPSRPLKPYKNYKARLTTAATSSAGAPLHDDFEWTFQTVDALSVTENTPRSQRTPVNAIIALAFDRDVQQASLINAFSVSPSVTGEITFPTPRSMRFVPSQKLDVATDYTVTLDASARGIDGVTLTDAFAWTFRTEPAPEVAAANPSGDSVSPTAKVVVRFSQAMDRRSVQQAFSLAPAAGGEAVRGAFSWNNDYTVMTFTPSTWLTSATTYEIGMAATATNLHGAPMAGSFSATFTVADRLQVSAYAPKGSAVSPQANLEIQFDRAVKRGTFELTTDPYMEVSLEWVSDSCVIVRPASPWTLHTPYTVTIGSGLTATDGTTLIADFVWQFETRGPVKALEWSPRGLNVAPDRPVTIVFARRMDPASVKANLEVWLEGAGRRKLGGRISWLNAGRTLVFTPATRWLAQRDYRVLLPQMTKAADGAPLQSRVEWMFQTANYLNVTYAPTGHAADPGSRITLAFSEEMTQASVTGGFHIVPAVPGTFEWSSASEVSFIPAAPLDPATVYRVTLDATMRSLGGLTLARPVVWEFQTAGVGAIASATALTAQQASSGCVAISFSLSASATVEVQVLNLAGRVVAAPRSGYEASAGLQSVLWNGRGLTGSALPRGTYLVRVSFTAADGSRGSAMTPLQLR